MAMTDLNSATQAGTSPTYTGRTLPPIGQGGAGPVAGSALPGMPRPPTMPAGQGFRERTMDPRQPARPRAGIMGRPAVNPLGPRSAK